MEWPERGGGQYVRSCIDAPWRICVHGCGSGALCKCHRHCNCCGSGPCQRRYEPCDRHLRERCCGQPDRFLRWYAGCRRHMVRSQCRCGWSVRSRDDVARRVCVHGCRHVALRECHGHGHGDRTGSGERWNESRDRHLLERCCDQLDRFPWWHA